MKTKLLFLFSFMLAAFAHAQFTSSPGDIIFTEFLPDPSTSSEAQGEWFEIMNTTSSDIDIEGWTIRDGSSSKRSHLIIGSLIVPANGYLLLTSNSDAAVNGGLVSSYQYGVISPTPLVSGSGTGSNFPTFNNSNSFDDGVGGCNSSVDEDGIDDEADGLRLLMPIISDPEVDTTDFVEIDRFEYDFGYNATNLAGSGKPDGIPNLQLLPDWDGSFTQLSGSSCYNGNASLDDDVSVQLVNGSWVFSDPSVGVYGSTSYYGTPGAANTNVLSVDKNVLASKFKIYPNPAQDHIKIDADNVNVSSIEMYSIVGKRLISEKNLVNNKLDISSLNSGVYLLKINALEGSLVKKIIVE
ncbi:T9SS type A sorting domain-containing protein [Algibacter sp. L3A6]|uniref:T9SS type A sorting domain-containing protein n=1 Tax=Algibacter sp. L3A6 TaxID=2686366 RepID=UPI00131DEC39|nr:T9SS type A sorting domain-containing protein [Algibacter sp. L3A6]